MLGTRGVLLCGVLGLGTVVAPVRADEPPPALPPSAVAGSEAEGARARIAVTINALAGPDRRGRRAWEDRRAVAAWIVERFQSLGLLPPPGRETLLYDQGGTPDAPEARHVLGWLPGASAKPGGSGDYVLVASHYDGVGKERGGMCPGANDNASGVAVLLEAARATTEASKTAPPFRSILFVAVDQKVNSNLGPRMLAEKPPLPLQRCSTVLTVEMVGRSLMDMMPGRLFAMGGEHSAALDALTETLGSPEGGTLSRAESDFHLEASVYSPFQEHEIPFLFVTSGLSEDRFQATDSPERLDYPHLVARSAWFTRLLTAVLALPTRPAWRALPEPRFDEVRLVREILVAALEGVRARGSSRAFEGMAQRALKPIDELIARGTVTREERNKIRALVVGMVRFLFDAHK